jgi:hypothetical protein
VSETGFFGQQLFSGEISWAGDTEFSIHKDGEKVAVTDAVTLKARAQAPVVKKTDEKKPR